MHSDELVDEIYYDNDGYCDFCGKKLALSNYGTTYERGAWEVDHWIPVSRRGSSDPRNLVAACVDCNREKGTMTGNEYKRYLRQSYSRPRPARRSSSGGLGDLLGSLAVVAGGLLLLRALSGNRRA